MTPLVTLRDRLTGVTVADTYNLPFQVYKLTYDSVMPGGMAMASLEVPANWIANTADLTGTRFIVMDGQSCPWWGTVRGVTSFLRNGMQYRSINASSPWEDARRAVFAQAYLAGPAWTSTDFIEAALFGNVPDVAVSTDAWASLALDYTPVTFSSDVQSTIAECLRIGDSTTSPWSFLILPPEGTLPLTTTPELYASQLDSLTGWTTFGTDPTVTYAGFQRQYASMSFWHAAAAGTSYVGRDLSSTQGMAHIGCWVRYPSDAVSEYYQFLGFYNTNGNLVTVMQVDPNGILEIYDAINSTSYNGYAVTLGKGCWHHICMSTTISATVGSVTGYLDFRPIISQGNINTGAANIKGVYLGHLTASVTNGRGHLQSGCVVSNVAAANTFLHRFTNEWLPYAYLFTLDTSACDLMLTLANIGDRFSLNSNIDDSANQVSVVYTGGESYLSTDSTSILARGQLPKRVSLTKVSSATVAQYLADRLIAANAGPLTSLSPYTLATKVYAKQGYDHPLSSLRAGLRFRILEGRDLGTKYIGYCRYTLDGGRESVEITPTGAPTDASVLLALSNQREWT